MQKDGQRLALTLTTYPDRPELPLLARRVCRSSGNRSAWMCRSPHEFQRNSGSPHQWHAGAWPDGPNFAEVPTRLAPCCRIMARRRRLGRNELDEPGVSAGAGHAGEHDRSGTGGSAAPQARYCHPDRFFRSFPWPGTSSRSPCLPSLKMRHRPLRASFGLDTMRWAK